MDKKAVDKNWVATQFLAFRKKLLSEISQMHESPEEDIEAIVNGTFAGDSEYLLGDECKEDDILTIVNGTFADSANGGS